MTDWEAAERPPTGAFAVDPAESVLDHIWEIAPIDTQWGYSFYPMRATWDGPAKLYITDPQGRCWRINAERHFHRD